MFVLINTTPFFQVPYVGKELVRIERDKWKTIIYS